MPRSSGAECCSAYVPLWLTASKPNFSQVGLGEALGGLKDGSERLVHVQRGGDLLRGLVQGGESEKVHLSLLMELRILDSDGRQVGEGLNGGLVFLGKVAEIVEIERQPTKGDLF